MISGGILQAANVPDSFNARTCSLAPAGVINLHPRPEPHERRPHTPARGSYVTCTRRARHDSGEK